MKALELVKQKIRSVEENLARLRKVEKLLTVNGTEPTVESKGKVEVRVHKVYRKRNGHREKCAYCGRGFIAHRSDSKHCSKPCRAKTWWAKVGEAQNAKAKAKREAAKAAEKAAKRGVVLIPGAQK